MNHVADVLAAFALVTGVLVATRPGSKGPEILAAFGKAVAHIEQGASGQKLSS